jgi:hypothetical protein
MLVKATTKITPAELTRRIAAGMPWPPRADAPPSAPPARPSPSPPAPVPPVLDDDSERDPKMRAARGRERGRIRAILLSDGAHHSPMAAIHVAVSTSVSRDNAIAALATLHVQDETMAASTTAEQILGAARKARAPAKIALPPTGSTARAILEAGARARGEKL